MMKKVLILTLICTLLLSCLTGCDLLDTILNYGKPEEPVANTQEVQDIRTWEADCAGIIINGPVESYSEFAGDLPVKTLEDGERVYIYHWQQMGDAVWAFTDCGWIPEQCLSVVDTSALDYQGEGVRAVTGDRVCPIYASAEFDASVVGVCEAFQEIAIFEFLWNGEEFWGCTSMGWVPLSAVQVDGAAAGMLPAFVTASELSVRSGPGTEYDRQYYLVEGNTVNIVYVCFVGDVPWGMLENNFWICLDYVEYPLPVSLDRGPGDIINPTQPTEPQGGGETTSKPPKDSSLVGSWHPFDEAAFLHNAQINPDESWVFYADGTFAHGGCESMYAIESGCWMGASGGWSAVGNYEFDGKELRLHYTYFYDADPSGDMAENRTETYNVYLSGNQVQFGDYTLVRSDNINDAINDAVRRNAPFGDAALNGVWNGNDGSVLMLRSDGTFLETTANGEYTGSYISVQDTLILTYDDRTSYESDFLLWGNYSISGSQLTVEVFSWEYMSLQLVYTRSE